MKRTVSGMIVPLLVLTVVFMVGQQASAEPKPNPEATTLDNLQAAFNGESNAHARYIAFATKADEEGYEGVASLFRAAARAEEVHANNHAEVIRKLGAEPKADVKKPEVRATAENLQAAIEGESYERDTMYPEFIAKARKDRDKDALQTFTLAKVAEAEHAKLYAAALENMTSWKSGKKTFWVCSVCGYTTLALEGEKCPSCFSPKEKFEKIS